MQTEFQGETVPESGVRGMLAGHLASEEATLTSVCS